MLVFVDESGDPGVRGKRDSSAFFVVTAVLFTSREEAQRCGARIQELREALGWPPGREFKFNKLNSDHRCQFLRAVTQFDFTYLAFAMDKSKLIGPGFQHKRSFYKYPVRLLFENAAPYLSNATVVIDKCGEREFRQQLEKYLKSHINKKSEELSIKKVKMQESHRDNLLQLADMICGAVARSLKQDKTDRMLYRALVNQREVHYQRWPK